MQSHDYGIYKYPLIDLSDKCINAIQYQFLISSLIYFLKKFIEFNMLLRLK